MRITRVFAASSVLVLVLAACSGSSGSGGAAGSAAPAGSTPAAASSAPAVSAQAPAASVAPASIAPTSAEPAPAASAPSVAPQATVEATAVPTSVDPCQVVTAGEAGKLAGTSFGAGVESTSPGNGKYCTYGSQTLNIFSVAVAQAPDTATAQQAEASFKADLEQASHGVNMKLTELPGFASGVDAAVAEGSITVSGETISASAIYLLKGVVFIGMSNVQLGSSAPSATDLEAQAKVALGRVP